MSTHWDLHCKDCNAGAGLRWNHGDQDLLKFLQGNGVGIVARLSALEVDVMLVGSPKEGNLLAFCAEHSAHRVVVRSEYGDVLTLTEQPAIP